MSQQHFYPLAEAHIGSDIRKFGTLVLTFAEFIGILPQNIISRCFDTKHGIEWRFTYETCSDRLMRCSARFFRNEVHISIIYDTGVEHVFRVARMDAFTMCLNYFFWAKNPQYKPSYSNTEVFTHYDSRTNDTGADGHNFYFLTSLTEKINETKHEW